MRAQALPQPAATGRRGGRRTIGIAASGVGRVWPVEIALSHRALATPVAGRAQCTLTRSPGVSSDTLVRLASELDACCVKKQCFGGRMAFDLHLSRASTGVVVMRQDSNY